MIPEAAPERGESWQVIFQDIERVIMPGVTHWHSPQFHAYFPTGNSWPAILADILSDAIGCIGFSWVMRIIFKSLLIFSFILSLLIKFKDCKSCLHRPGSGYDGLAGTINRFTLSVPCLFRGYRRWGNSGMQFISSCQVLRHLITHLGNSK